MQRPERCERLLVVAYGFERLLDVEVPVTEAVEAVGQDGWVAYTTGEVEGFAEEPPGFAVISRGPELAEIEQGLPLLGPVASPVDCPQYRLVLRYGLVEVAQ